MSLLDRSIKAALLLIILLLVSFVILVNVQDFLEHNPSGFVGSVGDNPFVAPPLGNPPSHHTIVHVNSTESLRTALLGLQSNTTILIAEGVYRADQTSEKRFLTPVNEPVEDVVIRGDTDDPSKVVIEGRDKFSSEAEFGIQLFNIKNVVVADLTVQKVLYHCVDLQPTHGTSDVHLYNLRLFEAGEQLVKSSKGTNGLGTQNLVIEYCVFEQANGWGVHPVLGYAYGNGISAHQTTDLVIRHCTFRNLYYTTSDLAGPAVLVWSGSTGTKVEGNLFINCARGVAFGLSEGGNGHTGGWIVNNIFYRDGSVKYASDVAFYVESSNTIVTHNTILVSGTYNSPVEVRYGATTNVTVTNNIFDGGVIWERDGTAGNNIDNNVFVAQVGWFSNIRGEDFHLVTNNETTSMVIDQVTTGWLQSDFDGDIRPQGSGWDLGADEVIP